MVEVPESGTGTVSLNMVPTTTTTGPTNAENPTVAQATAAPSMPQQTASAMSIPVLDHDDDLSNNGVADLELAMDTGTTMGTGILQQKNVQIWIAVLAIGIALLFGVFFFLARETALFQGNLSGQFNNSEDEEIIFDNSSDQTTTNTTVDNSSSNTGNVVGPTTTTQNSNTESADELLKRLLGESGDETVTDPFAPTTDDEDLVDGPVVDIDDEDFIDDPNQPIVPDDIFENTAVEREDNPFTRSLENNNALVPGGSGVIVTTGEVSGIGGNSGQLTLNSNTNPNVLSANEVQGNTGPGVLLYFIPPTFAYVIRRKNVR